MNWSDVINGAYETVGAAAIALNCWKLHQDKEVKGVHWLSTAFFLSWSAFNLVFYPLNGLIYSFLGGCLIVIVNAVWLCQLIYYSRKSRASA